MHFPSFLSLWNSAITCQYLTTVAFNFQRDGEVGTRKADAGIGGVKEKGI